ncbi:heavy metal translocating P-type ATPase [Methanocorpusculum vombati]|uniref:Heavy metal translocating P-type ATPase n=1 Tax=Methanocorpusculum vombati TaxID=3002864 RepID=A0ABT4IKV6_9EURY|nr:heavy metal translocating P-type ATPase [Methanocorpusculum vombati]MCZ9319347.1 heavy metal translocating P-type ATPase [Methanocorpusculum sp.]MCZ0861780.1 heavy metal translocating P-type ATPase [Methanocorpusculum vombati]MDE2521250.1 heavy metal translocating P-type ATPase [Methanocorpusculum sp.]MDE2534987.1 heavy metal translocating P-type ATPase [Methanocorpusculum sp.]MDE2545535.1 heavy metal translocating P-type ATPase [Methanocorpusculum sp.]
MQYTIVHDLPGRMRLRGGMYAFGIEESVSLEERLGMVPCVREVAANHKNGSILILYQKNCRSDLLSVLNSIRINNLPAPSVYGLESKRTDEAFVRDLSLLLFRRFVVRPLLPLPVRRVRTILRACGYFRYGGSSILHGRLDTPVLDASAIGAAMLQGDTGTASSIMFLLRLSGLLEDYTKKRTRNALVHSLAINVDRVWIKTENGEMSIPISRVSPGDQVIVRAGSMIPVDGTISCGDAMVNESSMTGEPLPVHKAFGAGVYAGTVVEEGEIAVAVRSLGDDTRINKIVDLIDQSEALKADVQNKAEQLADSIVPYSFLGAAGIFLFTGNLRRALSVLMVDYSCALKLSTPISVISAMREASTMNVMVKGGRYLEEFALADTIVFDKTGTLTVASPEVTGVIPFAGYTERDVLRTGACLEEHFPHSVARAIVRKAAEEGLKHGEEHAAVEYVVAHGIASQLHGKRALIGSAHFVFDDEGVLLGDEERSVIERESESGRSLIYLAIGNRLAGIICIEDAVRPMAGEVITALKGLGVTNVVMITGDGEATARAVASATGIDTYYSQVLPEDKAVIIRDLKASGRRVIMVGDGVNDTPGLAEANVSVAMKDASDIAREVADITLLSADLRELLLLRCLSQRLLGRINRNYRFILGFNTGLLVLGQFGVLSPAAGALLHNVSTMGISAVSMRPLLCDAEIFLCC